MPSNKKKGKAKAGAENTSKDVGIFDSAIQEAAIIDFTNAFNENRWAAWRLRAFCARLIHYDVYLNRAVLAMFAKALSLGDLHIVRDGFFLGAYLVPSQIATVDARACALIEAKTLGVCCCPQAWQELCTCQNTNLVFVIVSA